MKTNIRFSETILAIIMLCVIIIKYAGNKHLCQPAIAILLGGEWEAFNRYIRTNEPDYLTGCIYLGEWTDAVYNYDEYRNLALA